VLRQARRTSANAQNGKIAFAERRQMPKTEKSLSPNVGKGQKVFQQVCRTPAKEKSEKSTLAERRQMRKTRNPLLPNVGKPAETNFNM
jgi:hypothetical protein